MLTLRKDLFSPDSHLEVMRLCARPWEGRELMLATPPGSRYPYCYPRDLAGQARVLLQLIERKTNHEEAHHYLESGALFLLGAQHEDGQWGQRYDLDGSSKSIYRQEDNIAHGMIVLGTYLHACDLLDREPLKKDEILEALARAYHAARRVSYRPGINLFHSTTTVHESAIEDGYTLWNNLAFHRALGFLVDGFERWNGDRRVHDQADSLLAMHRTNVRRHFVLGGEFIRRVTSRGRYDRRPDVTLLSPFYFDAQDLDPDALRASADRIGNDLWDPDLGLLQRYLPYGEDPTIHIHAGNGPWLQYTAIYAQYRASIGETHTAREILDKIAGYANDAGHLPEHLSTRERFDDFLMREWETGLDFEKEFSAEILLPGVPFSQVVEELNHMSREYERIQRVLEADPERDLIRFAIPLMWTHAEFLSALMLLRDKGGLKGD